MFRPLSAARETVGVMNIPVPTNDEMRRTLGRFATGVTVITALDACGTLCGLTAFSAVSLEPPLVLACVDRTVRCYKAINASGVFTVHILHADQSDVATGFARKGGDRSQICDWSMTKDGRPLLSQFHAALECRLHEAHPGGDHAIVVGRVERIHEQAVDTKPLLYYRGQIFPLSVG
jgi:3-hydroxy-9,10-secoandrosta-1,3,5(10)-triene-9,17-dione monooxygenase reductase component